MVESAFWRGEEQNREEGEMAQKIHLGGGRNRGKKWGGGRRCEVKV